MRHEIASTRVEGLPAEQAPTKRFWAWLDNRLGISELSYPVPAHANNILYTLGGITAFGMVVLVITGVYLTQFYHPHTTEVRDSLLYIIGTVPFGAFVRDVHFWTANLVVVTLLAHLARVFATGAYKAPRELNWEIGVLLFATALGLFFTGTVLKWDQEAWEAVQHNIEIGKMLGSLGSIFTPEFSRSSPILLRLAVAHITILPFVLFLLMGLHFLLVKHHGISSPPGRDESLVGKETDTQRAMAREGAVPFLSHLKHLTGYALLFVVLGGVLALAFNAPLGPAAAPGPEQTKPPWVFLPLYPLENWFGLRALLVTPVILFLALAAVPFIDRSETRRLSQRKWLLGIGTVVALFLLAMLVYAVLSQPQSHIMAE